MSASPPNRESAGRNLRVAVLGAGPAGITAAYCLSKAANVQVTVYESQQRVGGMATTIDLWGQKVDLGPHRFFSSDPRVNRIWKEVVGSDYSLVKRLTRIYFGEKFFFYPLQARDVLSKLGLGMATACCLSYLKSKLAPPKGQSTFEGWVVARFGRRLFDMFFKSYSEKLWGISCLELDADFATQRIKKLSLFEAVKSAVWGGKNIHKTLVDEFAYPHGGSCVPYERMSAAIERSGGNLVLGTRVRGIWTDGASSVLGVTLSDGINVPYDHVISSIPLTHAVASISEAPETVRKAAAQLRFRNTILVYLHVKGEGYFKDQWLYIHDPGVKAGRITNFRNWVPQILGDSPNTIIVLEYWCNDDEADWTFPNDQLIARAAADLQATNLIPGSAILEGHVIRVPRCYPVYRAGYQAHINLIKEFLKTVQGLQVIGRYGAFKYNNQDHSILMGLLAAENATEIATHDLWGINSDYEYQEGAPLEENVLHGEMPKPV